MDTTNKELLLKFNNLYKKQLSNYMKNILPPTRVNYTNSKPIYKKVQFNTKIRIRYYELDKEERIEKRLIYNRIKLKLKLRNLIENN